MAPPPRWQDRRAMAEAAAGALRAALLARHAAPVRVVPEMIAGRPSGRVLLLLDSDTCHGLARALGRDR